MTELETFRDHCRAMSDPNPPRLDIGPLCRRLWRGDKPDHERCARVAPEGACGCECHPWNDPASEADRALWTRLADEIDAYLSAGDDEPLWGDS